MHSEMVGLEAGAGAGKELELDNRTACLNEHTSNREISLSCSSFSSQLRPEVTRLAVTAVTIGDELQEVLSPQPWSSPRYIARSVSLQQAERTKSYDIQVRHLHYKLPSNPHNSRLRRLRRFLTYKFQRGNSQLQPVETSPAHHASVRGTDAGPQRQEQQVLETNVDGLQYLLRDVSFDAKAGELLAIAGPSGAGKSTLLEVLAGRIRPTSSHSVLVNGEKLDVAQFRRVSSYVMQDDALFPTLTVRETLLFSARLRLPSTMSLTLKKARVESLLVKLGLEHVANSRIGSETIRGVSGGERRRVSIGVDIVHDPSVLLLDEPTSGLDSSAALNIVAMLKSMAEFRNCTVILSIHQPNFRILELMDSILLLAEGMLVHHGSLDMLSSGLGTMGHKIPAQVNVLEYAIEAMNAGRMENGKFSIELDSRSAFTQLLKDGQHVDPDKYVTILTGMSLEGLDRSTCTDLGGMIFESPPRSGRKEKVSYSNCVIQEALVLASRSFKNVARSRELFVARTFQSLAAGLTLGTIFINSDKGGREGMQERFSFFAFTMTFFLSSSTEALPVFLQERQILTRESSRGAYRIASYMVASAIVFAPFLFVIGLIYCIPTYYIVKLDPSPGKFFFFAFIIWLVLLEANSFVSFFAALVPNFIMGNALIMVCMGAFFLFCGYFISKDRIPKYWLFAHYLSLLKYPLEALLANEYQDRLGKCFDDEQSAPTQVGSQNGAACNLSGSEVLRQLGAGENKWMDVGIMVAFVLFYRFLAYVVVCYKISRRCR